MIDPGRIRHKGLKRFWLVGDTSKLRPDWIPRIRRVLSLLNAAAKPEELDMPGYGWHQLKGNREGTYTIRISGNWRLTYRWDENGPYDIELEDYHGR